MHPNVHLFIKQMMKLMCYNSTIHSRTTVCVSSNLVLPCRSPPTSFLSVLHFAAHPSLFLLPGQLQVPIKIRVLLFLASDAGLCLCAIPAEAFVFFQVFIFLLAGAILPLFLKAESRIALCTRHVGALDHANGQQQELDVCMRCFVMLARKNGKGKESDRRCVALYAPSSFVFMPSSPISGRSPTIWRCSSPFR